MFICTFNLCRYQTGPECKIIRNNAFLELSDSEGLFVFLFFSFIILSFVVLLFLTKVFFLFALVVFLLLTILFLLTLIFFVLFCSASLLLINFNNIVLFHLRTLWRFFVINPFTIK